MCNLEKWERVQAALLDKNTFHSTRLPYHKVHRKGPPKGTFVRDWDEVSCPDCLDHRPQEDPDQAER